MPSGRRPLPRYLTEREARLAEIIPEREITAPPWLHPLAREEWDRVVEDLSATSALTCIDQSLLAAYCQTFAQWREVNDQIMRDGVLVSTNSGPKQSPLCVIESKLLTALLNYGGVFGLSPKARGVLKIKPPKTQSEDEFDSFVDNGNEQHKP